MNDTRPRILAIDDMPTNLVVLARALEAEFDFQLATSGPDGLALARQSPPDLILLDVMMPGMDGYETCRLLKEDPSLSGIPVIFITALSDVESERRGLALGAADFVSKPFHVNAVRLRIVNLLEREHLRREVEASRDRLEEMVAARTADLQRSLLSLQVARDAAEVASRAKSMFIANMGHELRTPMNAIIGLVTLARRAQDDPVQAERLGKVVGAAERLMQVLNHAIDLADIEAERLQLASQPFRLATTVDALQALFSEAASAKGLDFRIELPDDLAAINLRGDPVRLQSALADLLANAIKFTERGFVHLRLSAGEAPEGRLRLSAAVSDSGVGIECADLRRVFRPFEQVDGSATRRHQGAGLGLSVSRRLAELMGGGIDARSMPGRGSTFTLNVVLDRQDD